MNYYSYLNAGLSAALGEAGKRWTAAKADIQKGTYSADKWTNDALTVWLDVMQPFWNVWGTTTECGVPIVAFNTLVGAAKAPPPATTYVLPPLGPLPAVKMTDLLRMGGSDKVPGNTDVTATLTDGLLEVTLKNLSALPAGNYQGSAYLPNTINRMIALVHLVIS